MMCIDPATKRSVIWWEVGGYPEKGANLLERPCRLVNNVLLKNQKEELITIKQLQIGLDLIEVESFLENTMAFYRTGRTS